MSDAVKEIKEALEELKKANKAISDSHAEHVKEIKGKEYVSAGSQEKHDKISKHLDELEEKQEKNLQALQDEVSKLKQGTGWQAEKSEEYSEKRLGILNRILREGSGGMKGSKQVLSLSNPGVMSEDEQKYFSKALINGNNQDGGFLAIPEMATQIALLEKERSPVRSLVTVQPGSASLWKEPVQTGRFGASRTSETAARADTSTGELSEQTITPNNLFAHPKISQDNLDDDQFNVVGYINSQTADEFNITEGEEFCLGTGPLEFRGITTFEDGDEFGKIERQIGIAALEIKYDDLVFMDELLLPAFMNEAKWLMRRTTRALIRLVRDTHGNPILVQDANSGLPQIFGKPIVDVPDMPSFEPEGGGAGNLPIAFGNFRRGYKLYDRMGMRTVRDDITDVPFVKFNIWKRTGGDVTNHQAFKLFEVS